MGQAPGLQKAGYSSDAKGEKTAVEKPFLRDELEDADNDDNAKSSPGITEKAKELLHKVGEKVKDAGSFVRGEADKSKEAGETVEQEKARKLEEKIADKADRAGDRIKDGVAPEKKPGKEEAPPVSAL